MTLYSHGSSALKLGWFVCVILIRSRSPSTSQMPLATSRARTSLPSTLAVTGLPKSSSGELYWNSPDSRNAIVVRVDAISGEVLVVHRPRTRGLAGWSVPPGFEGVPEEPWQPSKKRLQPSATPTDVKHLMRSTPSRPNLSFDNL